MKKLMVVAAAALCAGLAQAASVAWNVTDVSDADGVALGTGKAYVFFVQQDSGKADTSAWALLEGKGAQALTEALASANFSYKHSDLTAAAGAWGYIADNGVTPKSNGDLSLTGKTKYSPYLVIIDTETITDDTKFMVSKAVTASTTFGDDAGTTKTYLIGSQAGQKWYSVGAVPEPTSAMLLLLGVAGLALRRRRA